MAKTACIAADLADIWKSPGRKTYIRTVGWGDVVEVLQESDEHIKVRTNAYTTKKDGTVLTEAVEAFIEPSKTSGLKARDVIADVSKNDVLKVNFVDVQQGDGSVIEAPDGTVILVDGGDNQMFARYLAGRFRGTSEGHPQPIACILVTHGDADHFSGLADIQRSETNKVPRKRIFIQPERVYHNGIIKRPGKKNGKDLPEKDQLGPTQEMNGSVYLTGLVDDLLSVKDADMNKPFREWKEALAVYHSRKAVEFRRLQEGDQQAFQFFNKNGMKIDVLGPMVADVGGKPGLKFLGSPPKGPRLVEDAPGVAAGFTGLSASHTINGHSIVFQLTYKNVRYLFTGDLNEEASQTLVQKDLSGSRRLLSEVFKVPHHGSADFSMDLLKVASPVISVVSSGDENARKEYMHPRATLVGALGKYSRLHEPLIFITELVAFFEVIGWSTPEKPKKGQGRYFGFKRAAYGIVKTRTNGERLLVYTDSGNAKMKEAYAFTVDSQGVATPAPIRRA